MLPLGICSKHIQAFGRRLHLDELLPRSVPRVVVAGRGVRMRACVCAPARRHHVSCCACLVSVPPYSSLALTAAADALILVTAAADALRLPMHFHRFYRAATLIDDASAGSIDAHLNASDDAPKLGEILLKARPPEAAQTQA